MMATRSSSGFGGITQLKPVTSWSYSRYRDYEKCPAFFRYKYIDKIAEEENKYMIRGSEIHSLAEGYVKGTRTVKKGDKEVQVKVTKLPAELVQFEQEMLELKKAKARTELTLTFTKDWGKQCEWNDWNNAWVRVKVDAMYLRKDGTLVIIDHKTGKIKDEYRVQLSLYAIAGFLDNPNVKNISAELWYIDQGKVVDEQFTRDQLDELIMLWAKRTKKMLSDTSYKPTPSDSACKFCPYKKANGGPCRY